LKWKKPPWGGRKWKKPPGGGFSSSCCCSAVDHWLAAEAGAVVPIGADVAPVVAGAGAGLGAGAGVAAGDGVGAAVSFLPQAASATVATRVANRSDLFM
jgi:hypothetical protein